MEKNIYKIGKELFITSEEEIKEGDWCIMTNDYGDNYLVRVISLKCIGGKEIRVQLLLNGKENTPLLEKCEKIILTTDQDLDGVQAIDDEFLEWFVKNPSCEEIKIEWQTTSINKRVYKIIIPKEEPKQETTSIEEAAKTYYEENIDQSNIPREHYEWEIQDLMVGFCAQWQAERHYSEEEVIDLLQEINDLEIRLEGRIAIRKWFTQFKKK